MIIVPAIDIKDGKCVRLFQGDFAKQTTYSPNPLGVAKQWEAQGAAMIHIVDLDGAKDGKPKNFDLITNIVNTVSIPIEVGGGIRNEETIRRYLKKKVSRIVLGTVLLENFAFAKHVFSLFGDKIVAGLDAKDGELMQDGWIKGSGKNVLKVAKQLETLGAKRIIYTDIARDGSMTEPNYDGISALMNAVSIPIIASGGVSQLLDIERLHDVGVEGVVIGKALYEGKINAKELLQKFKGDIC